MKYKDFIPEIWNKKILFNLNNTLNLNGIERTFKRTISEEEFKQMSSKEFTICQEYCDFIKTLDDNHTVGNHDFNLDRIRQDIHDKLCQTFNLEKHETLHLTNYLDELDYSATTLYMKLKELK